MNSTLKKKILPDKEEVPTKKFVEKIISSFFEDYDCYKGNKNRTKRDPVTLDTLCCNFFPPVLDDQSVLISGPIEKIFELEQFNFKHGMPHHKFTKLGKDEKVFYSKYPKSEILSLNYPLRKFAEMIYDLCLIKDHMPIS